MSFKAMADVWENSPYSGTKLILHLAMASHANEEGRFFASQAHLAERGRCTAEFVRQAVNQFVAEGMIVIERKGTAKGRSTEYRILPVPTALPKSVGESETEPPKSEDQLPNSDGALPNSARGQSSLQTTDQSKSSAAAPDAAETQDQRINRLTNVYAELVAGMTNYAAARGVVKRAVVSPREYDDAAITEALTRLANDGRSLTVETLRLELEGLPVTRIGGRRPTRTDAAAENYRQFEQQALGG